MQLTMMDDDNGRFLMNHNKRSLQRCEQHEPVGCYKEAEKSIQARLRMMETGSSTGFCFSRKLAGNGTEVFGFKIVEKRSPTLSSRSPTYVSQVRL